MPTPGAGATPLRGAAAVLARYMDESRSVPTATSFRTITVSQLAARREQLKAAGHRVSFTHLIAYAIARVATDEMPAPDLIRRYAGSLPAGTYPAGHLDELRGEWRE